MVESHPKYTISSVRSESDGWLQHLSFISFHSFSRVFAMDCHMCQCLYFRITHRTKGRIFFRSNLLYRYLLSFKLNPAIIIFFFLPLLLMIQYNFLSSFSSSEVMTVTPQAILKSQLVLDHV